MILAGVLSLGLLGAAQAVPSWPDAPYSYYATNAPLRTVLQEVAGSFSLSLQVGASVSGTVNGRFNATNPTEFMNRLGGVYGFNWFVYAGTLYVSGASETATRSVSAMGGSITSMRQALEQLGVLDPRFGWGELPEQGVALVSGPPAYLDLIDRTIAAMPTGGGGQQVAVFRLKHASVNDRSIAYRNSQVVTPGLATVLRNLITGNGGNNNETLSSIAAPLRDRPPVFTDLAGGGNAGAGGGGANSVATSSPVSGAAGGSGSDAAPRSNSAVRGSSVRLREPTIQADARLNAIIVQDIPDRIPIYRTLIEQLDRPSTLIEIEAMIVDVNSEVVSELGVTWGARSGNSVLGYGNLALGTSGGVLPVDSAATALTPGTIGLSLSNRLAARIRALQTDGRANILSQPSILTADNLGALIDLSDTFYIQTLGERVATVTPVTVGTSLRVTPRFIEGRNAGQVELTVDIEDGSIQEERQIDGLPTVRRSTISTLAVVGNDQTLLIGGYNSSQDSEQIDKVPLLGDIPGFGVLFSSKSKTVQRRERLFMIRPRVIAINGEPVQAGLASDVPAAGAPVGPTVGQYLDREQLNRSEVRIAPAAPALLPTAPVLPATPNLPPAQSMQPVAAPEASSRGQVIRIEPRAPRSASPSSSSSRSNAAGARWDAPIYESQ
jgi:type III secretion protein C